MLGSPNSGKLPSFEASCTRRQAIEDAAVHRCRGGAQLGHMASKAPNSPRCGVCRIMDAGAKARQSQLPAACKMQPGWI